MIFCNLLEFLSKSDYMMIVDDLYNLTKRQCKGKVDVCFCSFPDSRSPRQKRRNICCQEQV